MQLITRADTSGRDMRLMDDSTETIHKQVEGTLASMGIRGTDAATDGICGRWYSEFLCKVNDAMEERDAQLTLLNVCNDPFPLLLPFFFFFFFLLFFLLFFPFPPR